MLMRAIRHHAIYSGCQTMKKLLINIFEANFILITIHLQTIGY